MADLDFAAALLDWFDRHGRHDLPWQNPATPYRVWVSEVMLQQTQVTTVIPYFERFLGRFPDLPSLAAAELDQVLALWSGLGYYARGRNLHRCARVCMEIHRGQLPADADALAALPGIGRSTAGAILSLAQGRRAPILDGNVKRVLARYHAVAGWPGSSPVARRLWQLATELLPQHRCGDYNQALMDLGASVCARKPACALCPLTAGCLARRQGNPRAYPGRKPPRRRPQRPAWALLLSEPGGALLLERRPMAGIWGGLWCPPLFDDREALDLWLQGRGLVVAEPRELAERRHGFTHFELVLRPVLIGLTRSPGQVMDSADWAWYRDGAAPGGVAAPIRRLLRELDLRR